MRSRGVLRGSKISKIRGDSSTSNRLSLLVSKHQEHSLRSNFSNMFMNPHENVMENCNPYYGNLKKNSLGKKRKKSVGKFGLGSDKERYFEFLRRENIKKMVENKKIKKLKKIKRIKSEVRNIYDF